MEIGGVAYVEAGGGDTQLYTNGQLIVSVESSVYSDQMTRDALIASAAASANGSATGSNCAKVPYTDYARIKRSLPDPPSPFNVHKRQYSFGSDWTPTEQSVEFCAAVQFTGVHWIPPPPADGSHIDARWRFQEPKQSDISQDLLCDFVTGLIDSASIELPIVGSEVGGAVGMLCKGDLISAVKQVSGVGSS